MLAKDESVIRLNFGDSLDDIAPLPMGLWERLAREAQPEYWGPNLEILQNLCRQHYRRLREQNRLLKNSSNHIYMNTSLRSCVSKEPIIFVFMPDTTPDIGKNRKPYGPPQVVLQGNRELRGLTPEIATWFDDPNLRFFDLSLPFNHNLEHIIMDRRDRLPEEWLKLEPNIVKASIQSAITEAIENIKRDDTQAIPFVFSPKHKFKPVIQWLLPLYISAITDNAVANSALVVERLEHGYRAASILTMEMAYKNARVVRTSPRSWLPTFPIQPIVAPPVKEINQDEPQPKIIRPEQKAELQLKEIEKKEKSQTPCRHFSKRGHCVYGDACLFQHVLSSQHQSTPSKEIESEGKCQRSFPKLCSKWGKQNFRKNW